VVEVVAEIPHVRLRSASVSFVVVHSRVLTWVPTGRCLPLTCVVDFGAWPVHGLTLTLRVVLAPAEATTSASKAMSNPLRDWGPKTYEVRHMTRSLRSASLVLKLVCHGDLPDGAHCIGWRETVLGMGLERV
jgi:hypothetical protein